MYRARVEQISGVNVRAGGKWLRCIGNKPVRVGDLIWTDGKCVYGYEKDSMTPLVITNNKETLTLIIPVFVGKKIISYYQKFNCISLDCEINNLPDGTFDFFCFKGVVYVYDKSGLNIVHSANCDAKKNIYKICSVPEIDSADDSITHRLSKILIKRNSETLFILDVAKETDIVAEDSRVLVQSLGEDYQYTFTSDDTDIVWSFVENENNWAFLLLINGSCQSANGSLEGVVSKGIYFDSGGVSAELFSYKHSLLTGWDNHNTRSIRSVEFVDNGFAGHKFPCQDGYYFTVDSICDLPNYLHGASEFGTITLYSPQDEPICTFIYVLIPQITVFKINNKQFLIGIRLPFQYDWASHRRLSCYVSDQYGYFVPIPEGILSPSQTLYLCDNGKLTAVNASTNCGRFNRIDKKGGWYSKIEEITV